METDRNVISKKRGVWQALLKASKVRLNCSGEERAVICQRFLLFITMLASSHLPSFLLPSSFSVPGGRRGIAGIEIYRESRRARTAKVF